METIVFINPPLALTERYGALATAGAENCPHAFLYLGAVTRSHGYNTKILDASAQMMTADDILGYIEHARPDYIGITASTISIERVAELSGLIKERFPDIKIIIGGPHISAVPVETFNLYDVFEYALIGEAELSLISLLGVFRNGGSLDDVPGLCYRKDGNPVLTPKSAERFDLQNIGVLAWDLLEGFPDAYSAAASYFSKTPYTDIITSRGCPFKCTFCDRSVFGNKVRSIGMENVIKNLEHLISSYGIKSVYFQDDTLLCIRKSFKELCDYLISKKHDLAWSCNSRIDEINEENLEMMKRAGCWQVSFGIESGSEKILKSMNKKITPGQIIEKLKLVKKYGIKANGYLILGTPFEDHETIRETTEFCRSLPLDTIRVSYFTPFPGSEMTGECQKRGTIHSHWAKFNFYNIVYTPDGLTDEDLLRAYKKIMRNFYLRPATIIPFLGMIKNPKSLLKITKGFYGLSKLLLSKKTR